MEIAEHLEEDPGVPSTVLPFRVPSLADMFFL